MSLYGCLVLSISFTSNICFPIYVFLQVWVPIQVTMDICLDSGHPVPNVEQVELVGQDTEPSAASFDMVNNPDCLKKHCQEMDHRISNVNTDLGGDSCHRTGSSHKTVFTHISCEMLFGRSGKSPFS